MIPEREREALMRLTMCAREECRVCMYQKRCDFDFQCELATKNMNILADALRADRKIEPQKSKWIYHSSDGEVDTIQCGKCGGWIEITIPQQLSKLKFCPYCGAINIEDEPSGYNLSPVETEPQTERSD